MDNHTNGATRPEITGGDKVGGHKADGNVITAEVQENSDVAVGQDFQMAKTGDIHGTFNQIRGVYLSESARDKQYQIVLHWDGKTRLRMFDLSNRVLSDIDLSEADLSGTSFTSAHMHKANLHSANLTNTDFTGADLSHTDLRGANLWQAKL